MLHAAAFRVFLAEKVDVAIMEVGLGGRLDATNCVPRPVVCGVSALGFDHMELLGNTLRVHIRCQPNAICYKPLYFEMAVKKSSPLLTC